MAVGRVQTLMALGGLLAAIVLMGSFAPPPSSPAPVRPADPMGEPLPAGARLRLGTTKFRHTGRVVTAAASPNGRFVAAATSGSLTMWDAVTGRYLWSSGTGWVGGAAMAFSPDGNRIASAGEMVAIEDVQAPCRAVRTKPSTSESYHAVAFSPDGRTLAVGTSGHIVGPLPAPSAVLLLDAANGQTLARLGGGLDIVEGVAFAPDGLVVAAASRDGTVRLWDVRTRTEVRRFEPVAAPRRGPGFPPPATLPQTRVAYSPDGASLAVGDWDGRVVRRDLATGAVRWQTEPDLRPVRALGFSPDGTTVVTGAEYGAVRLLDAATGRARLLPDGFPPACLGAFTPDGRGLLLWGDDDTVHRWDLAAGRVVPDGVGHTTAVRGVAVSPGGRTAASAGFDGVRVWDLRTGARVRRLGGSTAAWSVAVSPDGLLVAAGGSDRKVRVWPSRGGPAVREFDSPDSFASEVAFSPDGGRLYTSHTYVVLAWDLATGRQVARYGTPATREEVEAQDRPVPPMTHLAVSPDGRRVSVSGSGGYAGVRVWDTDTGAETRPAVGGGDLHGPLAFTPDGAALACCWDADDFVRSGVVVWDLAAGRVRSRSTPVDYTRFSALAYSPDGRLAAAACGDEVRVFSVADWSEKAVLRRHWGLVTCLAFTPDGGSVVAGSTDTTLLVWDLGPTRR